MTTTLLDTTAAVRTCVFALAGDAFALDVRCLREVAIFEDWTTLPLAPAHVLGVANLRGDVIPIVDARPLLGLPAQRGGERRVRTLVVAAAGLEAALVMDGVTSLEAFSEVTEEAGPRYAPWALGLLSGQDRLIPLLDASRLLSALRPGARSGAAA
jgi:purine-binding chemotaxis protein CheW